MERDDWVDKKTIFKENFFSTVMMLGNLPGGKLQILPSGSFISLSGIPSEDDNYLVFNPSTNQEEIDDALLFLKNSETPFIAPEIYDCDLNFSNMLESSGLNKKHSYTAMSLEKRKEHISDVSVIEIKNASEAEIWAGASWAGFGENTPVAKNYITFTEKLINCKKNKLYVLKHCDVAVSSGLIHYSEKACGLYYFSTLPEFRRQGFAHCLMDTLASVAFRTYENFVLLATEQGEPFYKRFGFESLYTVPIRTL